MSSPELARLRLETPDLERFRHIVGGLLRPFHLHRVTREIRPASLDHQPSRHIAFTRINWNNAVSIDAERINDCYLLQLPLRGHFEDFHTGTVYSRRIAQLLRCQERPGLRVAEDCELLLLRIDRRFMVDVFVNLTGACPSSSLQLLSAIDLQNEHGLRFERAMNFTLAELDGPARVNVDGQLPRWTEEFLVSALLESALATHRCAERLKGSGPRPLYMRRAEAYIESHLSDDFTVGAVAQHAGVSIRTLQSAFRRVRGTTLIGFRDVIRLERAYDELRRASPASTKVSHVAMKYGFHEFGRFSRAFRLRFGRMPREVLSEATR